jgi:uncharacterized membrane protein YbaN (DUF454 family)
MRRIPRNKYLRLGLAFFFLVLGVLGLLLPVMPGWAFIFVAFFIVAEDFAWARRCLDWTLCRLERYGGETGRRYVENYRRDHSRREAPGDERGGD